MSGAGGADGPVGPADLVDVAADIAAGRTTSRAVVEACLDRAREWAGAGAFTHVFAQDAVRAAEGMDLLLAAGHRLGPLHGVPVAVKDNIAVAGRPTAAGSAVLAGEVPAEDAPVVRALRSAGAVVVGHTAMHEFAWGGTSDNPHTGTVRNPWDLTRTPAGSSGGSGVAVAVGACWAALGTDTGGSIRLPSAVNGVTGLRPTTGSIAVDGIVPLAWSMDTVGPMARSARDCAVLTAVLTGSAPSARLHDGVDGLRLGVVDGYSLEHVQAPVAAGVTGLLDALRGLGALVRAVGLPDVEGNLSAQLTVEAAEPSAYHHRWLRERPGDYGRDVRVLLEAGARLPATSYLQAQRYRAVLREQLLRALEDVDVVVTPTLPFTATPVGATHVEVEPGRPEPLLGAFMRFTGLPSLTGAPALSVPCGTDADGLPVGAQLIARPGGEDVLFRTAAAFQAVTGHHLRRPALPAAVPVPA
ncbi:amidase [Kineococcus terrestris]|uniref:amidase n=1 Tax=Kineococcus terrestris TaxID=2044856 RepID=UPI0034DB3FA5